MMTYYSRNLHRPIWHWPVWQGSKFCSWWWLIIVKTCTDPCGPDQSWRGSKSCSWWWLIIVESCTDPFGPDRSDETASSAADDDLLWLCTFQTNFICFTNSYIQAYKVFIACFRVINYRGHERTKDKSTSENK